MSDNNTTTSSSPSNEPSLPLSPTSSSSPTITPSIALSSEAPTETPSEAPSPTSRDSCYCKSCRQQIRIVASSEFQAYFDFHIAEYQSRNPNISIELEVLEVLESRNQKDELFQALQQRLLSDSEDDDENDVPTNDQKWDGAMFPAHMMGTLEDVLWDLDEYLASSSQNQETMPYFQRHAQYGNTTKIMPLGGNTVHMYYRKDLLRQYNISVPRTWDEYNQAAQFFDSTTEIRGSCVSRQNQCQNNAYWTSLILSSITQTMGTSFGFFLDPMTADLNFGVAMEETLRLLGEQFQYGHEEEVSIQGGRCQDQAFSSGECALTYTWENQLLTGVFDIGVAPTPGSSRVLDRMTGQLEACTPATCPFGTYYEDIGIVNRAPYAAFGGWASGVSNTTANKQATADFFAYLQSQSLSDVMPNARSTFAHPYQVNHAQALHWINDAGVQPGRALEYTESVLAINSENAVLDLRMPNANAFYQVLDEEVYSFLLTNIENPSMGQGGADTLRQQTAALMETRIQNLISERTGFLESYQDSLGFSSVPEEAFNYIDEDFRSVAWGLSGLICFASFMLIMWTLLFRTNRVMKAFQPFLLIQCAMGLLFMGAAIIPLGFDDKSFSEDTLNITCMAAPWLYIVGFTVFYSSVYCKIRECMKIFKDPKKYKVLFVAPQSDFKFTLRLLILNGSILAAWTVTDPLKWERNEVDGGMLYPDGTTETYGMCRGQVNGSFTFSALLFVMNLAILLIGMIRALKCRFLVLEYNELQWLTLSLIPFFECWLIGGPVVALTTERPTVTFITLSFVIAASSVAGGMAIFAPKDWYVRKYRFIETRSRKDTEHTSSAGILVLKHPTFENQKQVDRLQMQLEEAHTCNTELEIEIRGMKDRFREMSTGGDKFAARRNMFRAVVADSFGSLARSTQKQAHIGANEISEARDEELASIEQFEKVWKMPDEEDETELDLSSAIPGTLESFSPLKTGQSFNEGETATSNDRYLGLSTYNSGNNSNTLGIDEESLTERSDVTEFSEPDDPNAVVKQRDFRDLNKMIKLDDFKSLESKAELLAQSFKAKLAGTGLIGDGTHTNAASKESSPTRSPSLPEEALDHTPPKIDFVEIVLLESAGQSSGVEIDYSSLEPARVNSLDGASVMSSVQKAGEPSRGDGYEEDNGGIKMAAPSHASALSSEAYVSKGILNGFLSPGDSSKKAGVSFTSETLFKDAGQNAYNIGEWSAVGGLSTVLTDLSDTSSFSSATSSAFSVSSMEATTRASSLETPFAKELDNLVAKKDWDGVHLAATNFESSSPKGKSQPASIDEIKKKKRELESSWRQSVSRSYSSEPNQSNG